MNPPASAAAFQPFIVGIGGTTRPNSTSERTLVKALEAAERVGARTRLFNGPFLAGLPIYDPATSQGSADLAELCAAVSGADGIMIATPGYHGSVSGLVKNALDGLEGLREDARPYLDGRAVGCIVTADGWQAGGTTMSALRDIVHALRGWPTPMGVAFNPSAAPLFNEQSQFAAEASQRQIDMLAKQVVDYARMAAAAG